MTSLENFAPPEIPEKLESSQEKPQPPFDPVKLRLEGCVALTNKEYKTKFGGDLPNDIKSLLSQALNGKNQEERDLILDDIIALIQNSDNAITDIKSNLESYTGKQTENSNEQNKIQTNENIKETSTNIKQLRNSVTNLNGTGKNYNEVLRKIQTLEFNETGNKEQDDKFKTKIQEILTELENPEILLSISQDLKSQDPQAYKDFKSSVIELQPSFRARFDLIEPKLKLALGNDTLTNTTISGDKITQLRQDGYKTQAKLNGAERQISRLESNFKLNSTLETDKQVQTEADRVERELNEKIEPITRKLQNLEAIKKYLETANTQNTDLVEVKDQIKIAFPDFYAELGLENINSINDLQRTIETQTEKLIKERDKIESEAKVYLDKIMSNHKNEIDEKQEIQKIILDFFHQIGLDRLLQATIEAIFEFININPNKHGLDKPIDPENGSLGFDTDFGNKELSELEKQKFIELYNKILTGSKEYPVRLENGKITFHSSSENAKANIPANSLFNIGEFENRSLGPDPVFQAKLNLSKIESDTK